ncbi:MAG: hypothetical protein IPP60_05975 [Sphingobacteriales bacterium]|nr:hypothetical protein [Sphingobacteriales bacterium]
MMNGSIEIKSKLNKGTKFTVCIPFFQSEKLAININSNIFISPEGLNNKIILIADDNDENRLVAKEILLSFNNTLKIIEAVDGKMVIDIMNTKKVDILLLI